MSAEDLLAFYSKLADRYLLKYIEEDPFKEEDDLNSFVKITEELGRKVTIVVGDDDIFVTGKDKVAEGINARSANGVIIDCLAGWPQQSTTPA